MAKFLWIDLEMTGLNVEKEKIIEVAALVVDMSKKSEWKELESYHAVVKQPESLLSLMDEWNKEHHSKSGLLSQIANGKNENTVDSELSLMVKSHFQNEKVVIAGNSISQDRLFINKYLLKTEALLHYRMLDVSSWKIIFKDIYNIKFEKKNTHRALDDIRESISELQFYLTKLNI